MVALYNRAATMTLISKLAYTRNCILAVGLILSSVITHSTKAAELEKIPDELIAQWSVEVTGDRPRLFIITGAGAAIDNALPLLAKLGWADAKQNPVTATLSFDGKAYKISIVAGTDAKFDVTQISSTVFEGIFRNPKGKGFPVRFEKVAAGTAVAPGLAGTATASTAAGSQVATAKGIQAKFDPDSAKVAAPALFAGEQWAYETLDSRTKVKQNEFVIQITEATATGYAGTDNGKKYRASLDLNVLESSRGIFDDAPSFFSFPLEVDKKWSYKQNWTNLVNNTKGREEGDCKVVGIEKIKVAAGEFMAFKIEGQGFWNNITSGNSGRSKSTIWYAPGAKAYIKYEYTDGFNATIRELTSFELKQP
jgi:hypothetical protein